MGTSSSKNVVTNKDSKNTQSLDIKSNVKYLLMDKPYNGKVKLNKSDWNYTTISGMLTTIYYEGNPSSSVVKGVNLINIPDKYVSIDADVSYSNDLFIPIENLVYPNEYKECDYYEGLDRDNLFGKLEKFKLPNSNGNKDTLYKFLTELFKNKNLFYLNKKQKLECIYFQQHYIPFSDPTIVKTQLDTNTFELVYLKEYYSNSVNNNITNKLKSHSITISIIQLNELETYDIYFLKKNKLKYDDLWKKILEDKSSVPNSASTNGGKKKSKHKINRKMSKKGSKRIK